MFGDYQIFVKLFMAPKTVININKMMKFRMSKCIFFRECSSVSAFWSCSEDIEIA